MLLDAENRNQSRYFFTSHYIYLYFIYIYFIFSHFADTNNTINNKFSDIISLISYIYIYILFI